MKVRRVGRYAGVYRLYDPQRECLSLRLWFDEGRAKRAAQKERQQTLDFTDTHAG